MTDTEEQPRELAARLLHDRGCPYGAECRDSPTTWVAYYALADAVLAAVTPVIRRQVAEEIRDMVDLRYRAARATALEHEGDNGQQTYSSAQMAAYRELDERLGRYAAEGAAIARSHSTQPTEEETNG